MPVALLDETQLNDLFEKNNELLIQKFLSKFQNPFPEIMTIEQVCKYTQYSRPTILKFIREKNFPVSRPCESQRFFRSQVDEWLKAQTEVNNSDERL